MNLTDNDIMPFGKYRGEAMANVPASHLLWLKEKFEKDGAYGRDGKLVNQYIKDNLEVLQIEIQRENYESENT